MMDAPQEPCEHDFSVRRPVDQDTVPRHLRSAHMVDFYCANCGSRETVKQRVRRMMRADQKRILDGGSALRVLPGGPTS
jgi:hypothetical protein